MSSKWIQTVLGKVDVSEMRYVSSHEHLITFATPDIAKENPLMVLEDQDKLAVDIGLFMKAGGNTIIDMTTVDYGRDLELLASLSKKTGLHIMGATGFNKGKFNRSYLEHQDPKEIAAQMVMEITQGVGLTKVKPGVIKFGTSLDEIKPWEAVGIEAAAYAHLQTGTPISTHTQAGTMAEEQVERLNHFGVPPEKVILCHLDQRPEFDLHKRLINQGVFLSYDSIPKPQYHTEGNAVSFIVQLAKEGLHDHVLVGGDFSRQTYYKGFGGTIGLDYNLTVFKKKLADALVEAGLPANQIIEDVFQNNARKAFVNRLGD